MYLFDCGLEQDEWRKVMVIFTSIFVTMSVVLYTTLTGKNKKWMISTLIASFLIAVFGYEIWINFGIWNGQDVSMRRSDALNCAIPMQINWLTNSIVDTGVAWLGIILVNIYYKNSSVPFEKFVWPAFLILLVWYIGQNIWVEMILYHNQIGNDARISWGPLMPLGPWYNPTLFSFGEREATLQSQLVWFISTFMIYFIAIFNYRRYKGK
ncbi:hypothetical protein OAD84_01105 [Pelagibacterales bacterium]|nr:hypothetical protein [Pelagibacterales bacterium]